MDYNGKTTKEEEDWEIPGTLVSSVILTALKVLRMKRAITFLRVSTKLFRQTFLNLPSPPHPLVIVLMRPMWQGSLTLSCAPGKPALNTTSTTTLPSLAKSSGLQPGSRRISGTTLSSAGKDDFVTEIDDPVQATGEKIQQVVSDMLPQIWELIEELKKDPTNKTNMLKLVQAIVYEIGLGNGHRPQGYALATQADIYTLKKVPVKPGVHNGYWKFKVGMMTKVTLKTDNIIWISCSHTCVKLIDAYKKIRDKYIEINRIS